MAAVRRVRYNFLMGMRTQAGGLCGKVVTLALASALILGGCIARTQSRPGTTWTPVYSPGRGPRPMVQAPPAEAQPASGQAEVTSDSVYGRPVEIEPSPVLDGSSGQSGSAEVNTHNAETKSQHDAVREQTVDELLGTGNGKGKGKGKGKKK